MNTNLELDERVPETENTETMSNFQDEPQQNAREAQRNAERRNAEQHSTEQHSKRRAQQTVCDGSVRLQRNTA